MMDEARHPESSRAACRTPTTDEKKPSSRWEACRPEGSRAELTRHFCPRSLVAALARDDSRRTNRTFVFRAARTSDEGSREGVTRHSVPRSLGRQASLGMTGLCGHPQKCKPQ